MTPTELNLRGMFKQNPILSSFSSYIPTNIKDIFKWSEFIVTNIPIAAAGIKKISEVPVTNFRYNTDGDFQETNQNSFSSWKTVVENDLNLKEVLLDISYNIEVYGNCFVSLYIPFVRMLRCEKCGKISPISSFSKIKLSTKKDFNEEDEINDNESESDSADYTYKLNFKKNKKTKIKFMCRCDRCNETKEHLVKDIIKKESINEMNVIIWNPHKIEIEYNPISNTKNYYYSPEEVLVNGIKKNEKFFLESTPIELIESVMLNKKFKFSQGKIYHAKKNSLVGVNSAWGVPRLVSAIPSVLSYLIYNKANEKIAMDYLVPLRTVFPTDQSGDMFNFMSGSSLASKLTKMVNKWKLDPSGIQVLPFPVGTQQILGDGKMLNLEGELQQKEVAIASALGVPIEFIKGGLSYTSQGPSLRLLENQLMKIKYDLDNIIDFIVKQVAFVLEKEYISISLLPFKIIDDLQEKATIVQLATQGAGMISQSTLMEMFNVDSYTEKQRIVEEQKQNVKQQVELQNFQQEYQTSLEQKAKQEQVMNQSSFEKLNQQALMQEAQQYVSQLSQMDEGSRKSQLDQMSKTNYILYGVVSSLLEMQQRKQMYQAGKQGR